MFEKEIKKAVKFIHLQQKQNGSFEHESIKFDFLGKKYIYSSTFPSSLIILALKDLKYIPFTEKIIKSSAVYLKSQANNYFSFNYWDRNFENYKKMPYPDDLDDTSLALSALYSADKKNINGKILAKFVSLLTTIEEHVGGPYKTWIVSKESPKQWRDVDIAVNANIAYFLHLQDISLPKLDAFLGEKIISNQLTSPYYPNEYPVIYFLSRVYNGKYKKILIKKLLLLQKNNYWENPLYTALAVSSLINLGFYDTKLDEAIEYLLKQQKNNYWNAHPFYIDPAIENNRYFAQSKALTTAFCIEAIYKYKSINKNVKKEIKKLNRKENLHIKIIASLESTIKNIDKDIFESYIQIKKRIFNDTEKQVSLLPYYFYIALKKKYKQKVSKKILIDLGLANTYGWIAYTIYDDFLDNEGNPKFLSLANIALRRVTQIYTDLFKNNLKFKSFYFATMDILDKANTWEVVHTRIPLLKIEKNNIPHYGQLQQLAEKSLGHVLSPMAIMEICKISTKQKKYFMEFFIHYLIARQLNDDAHDWKIDLKRNQINSVGSMLLKKAEKQKISFTSTKALQSLFWTKTIISINKKVLLHVKKAEFYLNKCSFLENKDFFRKLIYSYVEAMDQALEERKQALEFLSVYPVSRTSKEDLL